MIVACTHCSTRLQLEDAKVPSRPFTVRCPKCQYIINVQPSVAAHDGSALASTDDLPASTRAQREAKPAAATTVQALDGQPARMQTQPSLPPSSMAESELVRMLAALLQRSSEPESEAGKRAGDASTGRRWEGGSGAGGRRRTLLCAAAPHSVALTGALAQAGYEIFAADNATQAIEKMREEQMDVIILDPDFDSQEQGAAFIKREVDTLRPAQRRRVYFVQLNPSARTADAHTAFLNHVNLVLNPTDLADLPRTLERGIREMNDLYRNFNKALNVADL